MDIARDETAYILSDLEGPFPSQGHRTEADYFDLSGRTNRRVEFSGGRVDVLPAWTTPRQRVLLSLLDALRDFVVPRGLGKVVFAGLPVRVEAGRHRAPDVVFMLSEHADRMADQAWDGADLVMEIVGEDQRDFAIRRSEYARAGIPEYWIADPRNEAITVQALDGEAYRVRGAFRAGQVATSVLLPGFSAAVSEALGAAAR